MLGVADGFLRRDGRRRQEKRRGRCPPEGEPHGPVQPGTRVLGPQDLLHLSQVCRIVNTKSPSPRCRSCGTGGSENSVHVMRNSCRTAGALSGVAPDDWSRAKRSRSVHGHHVWHPIRSQPGTAMSVSRITCFIGLRHRLASILWSAIHCCQLPAMPKTPRAAPRLLRSGSYRIRCDSAATRGMSHLMG